jgi:fructokinase
MSGAGAIGGAGRVVVCGEALFDAVPEADPVPPGALYYRFWPGGGPLNTAVALGRLGVPVAFAGRLSTDRLGQHLEQHLRDAGVDTGRVLRGPEPTPVAFVNRDASGAGESYTFLLEATAAFAVPPDGFAGTLGDHSSRVAALHVGTLGIAVEPCATAVEALVGAAAEHTLVMLDPNVRPALLRDRGAFMARLDRLTVRSHVVKMSKDDVAWLAGGDAGDLATELLRNGPRLVVVTGGPDGARAWWPDGHAAVEAVPVSVVDTVGAGDAFGAGMLAWLHDHGLLSPAGTAALTAEAVRSMLCFASTVAAVTCSRPGADPPWRHDLPGEP